ncbi:MAG: helix-turn-helix domain-containing protein [Lachnospiraceae bacterium]|jgi:excisionase family DNA binding protein|nr:helix-turn-helix domain-containing protein [Lachnospiraceae bacterium]
MNEKITLTVKETAKSLGICEELVRDLVKTNGFPAIHFKRKIIINKAGLLKWLDNNNGKILY